MFTKWISEISCIVDGPHTSMTQRFAFNLLLKMAIKSKNLFDFILLKLQEFVGRLNLQRDQEVLDLGCGVGGSAFYMANVSRFSDENHIPK